MITFIRPKGLPHISTGLAMPRRKKSDVTFITQFFAQFPDFDHDSTAPVNKEYRRLRNLFYRRRPSKEEKKAFKSAFARAMGKQFASFYGSSVHDIRAWQVLCAALGINPIPKTIKECKDIIDTTHVNLVDFIDTRTTGKPVEIFETEKALRKYTIKKGKIYPKESAKESGVLKYLLRKILSPA